jgi:hypothetical protein
MGQTLPQDAARKFISRGEFLSVGRGRPIAPRRRPADDRPAALQRKESPYRRIRAARHQEADRRRRVAYPARGIAAEETPVQPAHRRTNRSRTGGRTGAGQNQVECDGEAFEENMKRASDCGTHRPPITDHHSLPRFPALNTQLSTLSLLFPPPITNHRSLPLRSLSLPASVS